MTTTVKVEACCDDNTEVLVQVREGAQVRDIILLNGDTFEETIYDEKRILKVTERERTIPLPADKPEETPKASEKKGGSKKADAETDPAE